jgi:hypothetical protein
MAAPLIVLLAAHWDRGNVAWLSTTIEVASSEAVTVH